MVDSKFFDISDILAEEEKVQVQIQLDAFKLDSLEYQYLQLITEPFSKISKKNSKIVPEEEEHKDSPEEQQDEAREIAEDLKNSMLNGTVFKTPLWLALRLSNFNFVKINIPKWYEMDFMNIALAEPKVINLREKNYNFYYFGNILAKKLKKLQIGESLKEIYLSRVKQILLLIIHSNEKSFSRSFINKLSHMEIQFYKKGKASMIKYNLWKIGKILSDKNYKVMTERKRIKMN